MTAADLLAAQALEFGTQAADLAGQFHLSTLEAFELGLEFSSIVDRRIVGHLNAGFGTSPLNPLQRSSACAHRSGVGNLQ